MSSGNGASPVRRAVAVFAIACKLAHLVYRALRYEERYRKQRVSNLNVHADSLGYCWAPQTAAAV